MALPSPNYTSRWQDNTHTNWSQSTHKTRQTDLHLWFNISCLVCKLANLHSLSYIFFIQRNFNYDFIKFSLSFTSQFFLPHLSRIKILHGSNPPSDSIVPQVLLLLRYTQRFILLLSLLLFLLFRHPRSQLHTPCNDNETAVVGSWNGV